MQGCGDEPTKYVSRYFVVGLKLDLVEAPRDTSDACLATTHSEAGLLRERLSKKIGALGNGPRGMSDPGHSEHFRPGTW